MGRTRRYFFQGAAPAVCLLIFVISWACSGGGGSSEGGVQAQGAYGKVGVLITDAPSQEYEHIWVTITEISLLAGDCTGGRTCLEKEHGKGRDDRDRDECDDGGDHDCKGCDPEECGDGKASHEDEWEDGACDEECGDDEACDPDENGGDACRCRDAVAIFRSEEGYTLDLLQYRDDDFLLLINEEVPAGTYSKIRMKISEVTAEGGPCGCMEIKLPGGRIDLNPRSPIQLGEGELIYLRLDIDADKSIHLHPTGSCKCIFRPVVFVDILAKEALSQCPKFVSGLVKELHDEDGDWIPESFTLKRRETNNDDCLGDIRICCAEDTLVFTGDGRFGSLADIQEDQQAKVRGMIHGGCFTASLVILGGSMTLEGVIDEIIDSTEFLLSPDPCKEPQGPVKVVLQDQSLVLGGCDTPLDPGTLEAGMRVLVTGGFDEESQTLSAAVVLVRAEEICGTIRGVEKDENGHMFVVETDGGRTMEIFAPSGARIALEGDGEIPHDMIRLLACHPYSVRIIQGCDGSLEVLVTPESLGGEVEKIYTYSSTLLMGGSSVRVMLTAAGVHIGDTGDTLVSLDILQPGDDLRCFGLKACGEDLEDFHAFVYLVNGSE